MSDISDGDCRLPSAGNGYEGREGRQRFLDALDSPVERLVCARQVHGAEILLAHEEHRGQGALSADSAPGEYDAIITKTPNLPVAVSVADCVPVLIFDPEKRAAAAAHAGRLGTMSDIAGKTVAAMQAQFGSDPAHLLAEIGPSAGPNQYEVSEEIAAEFEQLGLPKQGRLLDLWGANRLQLESAGLLPDLIRVTGQCTIGDSRYYSHRRQKTLERNLAVVMI